MDHGCGSASPANTTANCLLASRFLKDRPRRTNGRRCGTRGSRRTATIHAGRVTGIRWKLGSLRRQTSKEKALEMFVQRQPMGRVAEAAEIAPIVVYLASDEAAFTTGTVMNVDGGFAL